MTPLVYAEIETQLAESLPELQPALTAYWADQGGPGEDPGPYVCFELVLRDYIDALLAAPTSARRNELLVRAFAFIERMIATGAGGYLYSLAAIALFESRATSWYTQTASFWGESTRHEVETNSWNEVLPNDVFDDHIDLYGAGELVRTLLSSAGAA